MLLVLKSWDGVLVSLQLQFSATDFYKITMLVGFWNSETCKTWSLLLA